MSESTRVRNRIQGLLARRPDLEASQIGAHTRLAKSTVNYVLSGKDYGDTVNREFNRVLDRIEAGDILPPGAEPITITEAPQAAGQKVQRRARDFYVTETVNRIGQVINYCADQAAIGVVTGEYGVGKTEALQYWRNTAGRKIDHIVFEFDEFSARNVVDFVNCLADHLQIDHDGSTRRGGETMRKVCARLEAEPMLLILDQCESCNTRVFQVVRQIWDHTRHAGVGVVMLASPLLAEKLQGGRMKDVGALTSRVGIWAPLRGLQAAEAVSILKQEGVENIEDAAADLLYRSIGGSMRRLMAVTDLLVAKHKGKAITENTIAGVAKNLWGLQMAAIARAA